MKLRELHLELDAERSAAAYWRRVALQRSGELAALRLRPSVRALLAVERRLALVVACGGSALRRARAGAEILALSAGALRGRGPAPPTELRPMSGSVALAGSERRLAVVVVGTAKPGWANRSQSGVEVALVAQPSSAAAAIARSIRAVAPDVVGVVAGTTVPLDPDWLDRLAGAIKGTAVAATPLVVHPRRPLHRATAHDGLVRAAGVGLHLDGGGTPQAKALGAGTPLEWHGDVVDVDAASGAALLVDRAAYEAAGGLSAADDLDAAVVELCARLRAGGAQVVLAPSAVAVDHRSVRTRRELTFAVDPASRGWAAAIHRSGAVLRRVADVRQRPPLRLALTVSAPSAKMAPRWGDWHLAQALAGSLRGVGHEVRVQTADQADDLAGRSSDVHLVLRGLNSVRRTPGQRHVLWIISHPEAIDDEELDAADLVLVASERFADHLRSRTDTPVDVLLQATDHRRFRPHPVDPVHRHDVTIVAKTRDVLRPAVVDALAAGLRPHIYGGGWRSLVDPALVVAEHVDNEVLPVVYSSAGVVLNDHWRTMRTWGFVSNRLFDVLACGTPVISDRVDGLEELFDGAVLEYGTPSELGSLVRDVLADPTRARERANRGRKAILAHHTFDHRARQLTDSLARHAAT
jgi:hypothetical protein